MALSNELISQFAKLVKEEKKPDNGTIVYGKILVKADGQKYVLLDGSDFETPITEEDDLSKASSTTDVKDGDRVSVLIKNHTATITGNISSPSVNRDTAASKDDLKQIQEFDILIGEKVTANEAYIKQLQTEKASVLELQAAEAEITKLEAKDVEITGMLEAQQAEITNIKTTKIDASVVEANYATIESLNATDAKVRDLEAYSADIEELKADNVTINNTLEAHKATIDGLDVNYANIDFSNIKMAAVEELFAKSGIIKDLVVGDTSITGELVGVTLKGDLIEAGTLKADKLVVKGSDGIFYKLNVEAGGISAEEAPTESLHGSVITAKSITAEKVSVKDLVAFGATIGGFHITDDAIYSGSKASADNTTTGVYQGADGQFAVGDSDRFLKFYREGEPKINYSVVGEGIIVEDIEKFVKKASEHGISFPDRISQLFEFRMRTDDDGFNIVTHLDTSTVIYDGNVLPLLDEWGVCMDGVNDGQTAIFDVYLSYDDVKYKLAIAADDIRFTANGKSVETVIDEAIDGVNDTINKNKEETDKAIADFDPVGKAVGNPIRIDDVSSIEHEMKVQLGGNGNNIFGGLKMANAMVKQFGATIDTDAKTVYYTAANCSEHVLTDEFKSNTQYTIIMFGKNHSTRYSSLNMRVDYTDGTYDTLKFETVGEDSYCIFVTDADKSVNFIQGEWVTDSCTLYYEKCGIFEGIIGLDEFEPLYVDFSEMVPKKNLIPYPFTYTTMTDRGITFTDNGDGTITANGTATGTIEFRLSASFTYKKGITYTLSGCPTGGGTNTTYLIHSAKLVTFDIGSGATFKYDEDMTNYIAICVYPGAVLDNVTFKPQLELGPEVTEYEPYQLVPAVQVSAEGLPSKNVIDSKAPARQDQRPSGSIGWYNQEGIWTGLDAYYQFLSYGPYHVATGETITLSFECENIGGQGRYILGKNDSGGNAVTSRVTTLGKNAYSYTATEDVDLYVCFTDYTATGTYVIKNIMLCYGTDSDYEPFKHPTIYYAKEDGSVSGVKSIYPVTTLTCNNQYATIECEYNKDNTLGNDRSAQTTIEKRVSDLAIDTSGISARVSSLQETYDDHNDRIFQVEKDTKLLLEDDSVNIRISKIENDGVSRVVTETGYEFTDEGMTVHKNTSEMKTQITDDGMKVSKQTGTKTNSETGEEEPVFTPTLTANSDGVDAKDLKASTYLIIGGRSRFQNYEKNGKKRTACFWIGG